MKNKIRLKKFVIGINIILLFSLGLPAAAAENAEIPDVNRKGSLTIYFRDSETGEGFSFGTKVGLFKVANIEVGDGFRYVYDELFESVGDPPTTASEMDRELAQRLEETANYKGISLDSPSEELSEEGIARFVDLEPGLYLVVQTHRGTDSARFQIEPFLVTVPVRDGSGRLLYNVQMTYQTGNGEPGTAEIAVKDGTFMMDAVITNTEPWWEKYWIAILVSIIAISVIMLAGTRIRGRQ